MGGYWMQFEYYPLAHGCGPRQDAAFLILENTMLHDCMVRCSEIHACAAVSFQSKLKRCRLKYKCNGEAGKCVSESCAFVRGDAASKVVRRRTRRDNMLKLRDVPRALPHIPIGQNGNVSMLRERCPTGEFISCFSQVVMHTRAAVLYVSLCPGSLWL